MARSRMILAGLVPVLALALVTAGCAAPAPLPSPAAVVVAPTPPAYSCAQSQKAAAEFDALPAGAVLRVYVSDYGTIRRQLRALRGLPDPPKCSSVPLTAAPPPAA